MATKITTEVLEHYLHCKTKGYLKAAGQQGARSAYGVFLAESRSRVRLAAIDCILTRHHTEEVERNIALTASALRRGPLYILDATLEDGVFALTFDGLKRVAGPSKVGDFHYVPILFHEGRQVRKEQRQLLEALGLLLSKLQGRMPGYGIVWHGDDCRTTRVHLRADVRAGEKLLQEIHEACTAGAGPRLVLNSHCPMCEYQDRCRGQAARDDDLSLLSGLGDKEIRKYNRKGIFTVSQLSCTFRLRKRGKRAMRLGQPHYFALQAAALRDKKTYVLKPPLLPGSPVRIYLDIEGLEGGSFVYLVGMLIVDNGAETWHSLWADGEDAEPAVVQQMLELLSRYDDFTLIHYGSYERSFLKRIQKVYGRKAVVAKPLARSVNLLSIIHSHIYFPVYSNGLKSVGRYLGCTWTDPHASGLNSLVLRHRWETRREVAARQQLETYNREDCMALRQVADLVYQMGEAASRDNGFQDANWGGCSVASAGDINPIMSRPELSRAGFALPDLDHVNQCAYFAYQRQKVYLRTSPVIRKANARKRQGRHPRKLAISRRIEVTGRKCPHCGSASLDRYPHHPHTKIAYDLKVTASGIRRQVIACTAALHRCRDCNKAFLPPRYKRRDKHFHSLKRWAMYHHIAHRISFVNLETMIQEAFGFHVDHVEIHWFKVLLARYYRATYQQILSTILAGDILHADETHVNFQKGKGYVWVLANMENVVYVYRPSRDGDWLQPLLADFAGVLITDFFSTYDSLPCEQQKCHVHLIRDMNQDLLENPFDAEFKELASRYGALLRSIIDSIDTYGLRARHLHKHLRGVDRFYHEFAKRSFTSDLAIDYWRRLTKYQAKLFTFLRHDGVPWNNNNAEHAIKPFAKYRVTSDGQMTEQRLPDYLVLRSICETCKYRGLSFLKFMLSREKDINAFLESKQPRDAGLSLQLYPQGFCNYPRKGQAGPDRPFFPHG
jgi:predicted RecB family nuclease